jgi:hypothetical protein
MRRNGSRLRHIGRRVPNPILSCGWDSLRGRRTQARRTLASHAVTTAFLIAMCASFAVKSNCMPIAWAISAVSKQKSKSIEPYRTSLDAFVCSDHDGPKEAGPSSIRRVTD